MTKKTSAAKARQRINEALRRYEELVEGLLAERGPLLQGAFQLRGTRCGKDNCKCTRGELHTTAVLVTSEDGVRRSYYLRPSERVETQRRVERHQRFRQACSELNKTHKQIMLVAAALHENMKEPHKPQRDTEKPRTRRTKRGKRKRK